MIRSIACAAAFLVLAGAAVAEDKHHDGHAKVKVQKNGNVHLGTTKHGHAPHAVMNQGKVSGLVVHKNNKDVTNTVKVKKFKTSNKKHLTDGVVCADGADANAVVVWIGFGFFCPFDSHWHIFWFPVDVVIGGDEGAEEL